MENLQLLFSGMYLPSNSPLHLLDLMVGSDMLGFLRIRDLFHTLRWLIAIYGTTNIQ